MRTELTLLEKIDLYVSGKLDGAQRSDFEQLLSKDEVLKQQVEAQKQLVKAVKRKALRAQVHSVAAAASAGASGLTQLLIGIGSVVGLGIIIISVLYFNDYFEEPKNEAELVLEHQNFDLTEDISEDVNVTDAYRNYKEEPETIFSSQKNYEAEHNNDNINVEVNFRPRGDIDRIESKQLENDDQDEKGKIRELTATTKDSDNTEVNNKNRTKQARYPGGNVAMKKFMDKYLNYPKTAYDKGIECVVRCEFHVTEDGLISEIKGECIKMSDADGAPYSDVRIMMNTKIMNSFIGNATHILRIMPTWEPAVNAQGSPILSVQRIYFNYDLEKGCLVYQLDED